MEKKEKEVKKTTKRKTTKKEAVDHKPKPKKRTRKKEITSEGAPIVENKEKTKKGKSTFKTPEVVVLVLLTCIISLSSGIFLHYKLADKLTDDDSLPYTLSAEVQEFINNYNHIVNDYYKDVDKKELVNSAIKGMIDSLEDPYSVYMNAEESDAFNIQLDGSYQGLGIQIANNVNGDIIILRVFENSPAARAGLQILDVITHVNEINLAGKTATEFTEIVKNSTDKTFNVTIVRNGKEQILSMEKETVIIKSVFSKTFEENNKKIGYLNTSIFALNTYQQFKEELQKLEDNDIDSLIIDLRSNSGGHLSVAQNMISLFLDSSHVIYKTESRKGIEIAYSTGATTKKYPIVIISNGNSASASEVMMGALRDEYGATIVGEASFGKGTVQEMKTVSSGNQYKFTTKKWLTPKGYWVEDKGIEPDVQVTLNEEYYENPGDTTDNQLQSAITLLKNS